MVFKYTLKGVGVPEYYSGADINYDEDKGCWTMSAKTYIKNVTCKIELLLEVTLKNYGSPMEAGDHPEVDETDLLVGDEIAKYQMLIGCAQWAVTLGHFDVQYATNTMARFSNLPREGHMDRMLRLFGYLKHNSKAKIYLDPGEACLDGVNFTTEDWTDLYPNAEEALPPDMPEPMTDEVRVIGIVDASHATDLVTRHSITGFLVMIGQAIIMWYCKRQNTVETSSYGSELVASRLCMEAIIGLRYKLRMMGINVGKKSTVLGDNLSVITNLQYPSSSLKKKHNAVAYHKCREAIAAGIMEIGHIPGNGNISDLLTKSKGPQDYYKYLQGPMYGWYDYTHPSRGVAEWITETNDNAMALELGSGLGDVCCDHLLKWLMSMAKQ